MGVAAAMAVLESKTVKHGPLEALFTTDEETGMTGAFGLKKGVLKSDYLLNLDSETEGELYVGCAGGIDATLSIPYKTESAPKKYCAMKLTIGGLQGGHSGWRSTAVAATPTRSCSVTSAGLPSAASV